MSASDPLLSAEDVFCRWDTEDKAIQEWLETLVIARSPADEIDVMHCARCYSLDVVRQSKLVWRCRVCKLPFSVRFRTIAENSSLSIRAWLVFIWLFVNGGHSGELLKALGVSSWSYSHARKRMRSYFGGEFSKRSWTCDPKELFAGLRDDDDSLWPSSNRGYHPEDMFFEALLFVMRANLRGEVPASGPEDDE